VQLDLNQLRELLAILSQTDITELTLKSSDFELTIRKGESPREATASSLQPTAPSSLSPSPSSEPVAAPAAKKGLEIVSPMVGTFYRSPAPDEPPFVEIDDVITRGQAVCIIEAMKLMNEIEAEFDGRISEILVQSGEPVEYGQPLLRVTPSSG